MASKKDSGLTCASSQKTASFVLFRSHGSWTTPTGNRIYIPESTRLRAPDNLQCLCNYFKITQILRF